MLAIILAIENEEHRGFMVWMYEEYSEKMYRYAIRSLKNKQDAEDAVQHAFIRMINCLELFLLKERDEIAPMIVMLMRSVCSNRRKMAKNYKETSLDSQADLVDQDFGLPIDEVIISADSYQRLLVKVNNLPKEDRDIILLRIKNDLSFDQIGKLMQMKSSAVRQRYHRAKNRLAEDYAEEKAYV